MKRLTILMAVAAFAFASRGTASAQLEPVVEEVCTVLGCLSTCNSNLSQSQSDLATCNASLSSCHTTLSDCNADLTACQASAQVFPASGQTTAYTADKNDGVTGAVAVPDDGTVEAGATLHYVDNGDGTITDLNTGLMWEKKAFSGGLHDRDNLYVWSGNGSQETIWDWFDDVNAEGGSGFAGHDDWRIPNVKELQSIVNYGAVFPAVSPVFHTGCSSGCTVTTCSCTVSSFYWSGTTYSNNPVFAWGVGFNDGFVDVAGKDVDRFVRAVRGGSL